jgi:alcohol dehydrogenase (NADP+)
MEGKCTCGVLSPDKYLGGVTYGGYSESIVVDEHFVLRVPSNLDLAGVSNGKKVGVVGLGGLGHMGVKFAHAFGAHVVVFEAQELGTGKNHGCGQGASESEAR